MADAYETLLDRIKDINRLRSIGEFLDWDQETYMPKGGVRARAQQSALIAGLAHDQLVSDETRSLLDKASPRADDFVAQTNVRETRRVFQRKIRIPTELVKELAHTSSLARQAWIEAREKSDFSVFAPLLEKTVELKKQEAQRIGFKKEPYDALIDEYEPGTVAAEIDDVFSQLRERTVALLEKIEASPSRPDHSIITRHYPRAQQEILSKRMSEALHFDFDRGRADVAVHPFCATVGDSGDVRITTRFNEDAIASSLFGTIHETGHALYEQGLLSEHAFTPMGEAASVGIHESQSRLWENLVGRGRAFWTHHWDELRGMFPEALSNVSIDEFYRAINTVQPSLIRVEADELTYNLHIILRFEIERGLLDGSILATDVPAVWNERMTRMIGITPDSDASGCLQDIHWSMGAFGYFPTYALGNLYGAQFFEQAKVDMPDLFDRIAAGDYQPLLTWLREKIHRHGQRYRASKLVEVVTGKPLSIEPFMKYVTEKFAAVYEL